MAARSYNPGVPTQPVRIGAGLYAVDSFRGDQASYRVNLQAPAATCSCPHFTGRLAGTGLECKHIAAAKAERTRSVWALAANVPTAHLDSLLAKYKTEQRWDVVRALWCERWDRTQVGA
jgi:hypothetical protein